jgi:hypothetical protein
LPAYRHLVADLLTGTIREEIPFSTVKYSHVLNRPGGFAATLPLRHPKATRANLDPGRTAIYVERNGVIMWGGILWTAKASVGGASVEVGGEGFWSYFRRRLVRTTKVYAGQDQCFIARDLVNYAQAQAGGDMGVAVGAETSGVLRDRTYYHYERKKIGEAVEQLAAVQGGFDFNVDVAWVGGVITKTLRVQYPRRGRATAIVFELGSNIEDLDQEIDATRQANIIDGLGAGEGDATLITTVSDLSVAPPYPLLEDVVTYKDVSVSATLQAASMAELVARSTPVERLPSLTARAGPDTDLGSFITGDTVTARGADGFLSVDQLMRITNYEVSVNQNGREAVAVGLQSEGDFS